MLTGADLLAKVKELGDVSKSDLVRGCGYVSIKKDGTERLNFTAFYEALLEAKGMNLCAGRGRGGKGRPGRQLSYLTKVQFNGNLLVGKAYTSQVGLQPGDELEIKLGRKQITLIRLESNTRIRIDQSSQGSPAEKPLVIPSVSLKSKALVNYSSLKKFITEIVFKDEYPLSKEAIKSALQYTMGAIKSGTIGSPREAALCTSALLLAGVKEAELEGLSCVTPDQIGAGWEKHLRYCPGNLPPDECMLRSVVEREELLNRNLPGFSSASKVIGQNIADWGYK